MSVYTDIFDVVSHWTNRPQRVDDINIAIKNAIRLAHKAAFFARDVVSVDFTGLSTDAVQSIAITDSAFARFNRVVLLGPTGQDLYYDYIDVTNLIDADGYAKTDVYWQLGTYIKIRANSPSATITCVYQQRPNIPADITTITEDMSWIAANYTDLIGLWASASLFATAGEQEIKTRVEGLAAIERAALISDNLHLEAR